ncbi:MAG: hypothetical protein P8M30_19735 [Planctomycetaceae bacterium]|nr:hypothetical protein [Planctomycetaceae bacterium]
MKISFTTAALTILTLSVMPAAYADHDHDLGGSPEKLAIALANQSREIVQEFNHHFPHKQGLNQRAYIICRLAESSQYDVLHRRDLHSTIRQVEKLEDLLDDLEDDIDDLCDDRKYRKDRHVVGTVKKAESLAKLLQKALKNVDRHAHHAPPRPVRHEHDRVGHRLSGHDHRHQVVNRPGYISFSRGGFSFGIQLR